VNDRPIVGILKFIGFIDENGVPKEKYVNFRDSTKAKSVMANCLREAYAELFEIYPDAYDKDTQTLKDFFSTRVTAGEQVLARTVDTFKVLCEFADFKAPAEIPKEELKVPPAEKELKEAPQVRKFDINFNIQLILPTTNDADVYDKIFAALKKHLLVPD